MISMETIDRNWSSIVPAHGQNIARRADADHPLDFFVQCLRIIQIRSPVVTQSEKQIYRPLRRNGSQQIAEPYIQIGTFLHIAVLLFSMEHFEQNIHIRVKALHFQQFGNTEITYSVNKDLNQHGDVNAAVK